EKWGCEELEFESRENSGKNEVCSQEIDEAYEIFGVQLPERSRDAAPIQTPPDACCCALVWIWSAK
ncbi:hypothetical protein MKW98_028878, partial [Papaver atlanticum]